MQTTDSTAELQVFPAKVATLSEFFDATGKLNVVYDVTATGVEKDYGVLWLRNYSKEYCAINPMMIKDLRLTSNEDLLYQNNHIVGCTSDGKRRHCYKPWRRFSSM